MTTHLGSVARGAALAGTLLAGLAAMAPASAAGLNGDPAYSEGPQVCGKCHAKQYDDWLAHGHSRKLGGAAALAPIQGKFGLTVDVRAAGFPLPPHDPDVYNWDNVLFAIGVSKHWKTRYVGKDGFVLTKNGRNQYNWQDGSWANYHKDEEKPFTCGTCHTTGYRKDGKAFADGFPGTDTGPLPGIKGDWAAFNITCEACHGPGAEHAAAPKKVKMKIDKSAKLCGSCHVRGKDPKVVIAKGGFNRHHEQYPELLNSPHKKLKCGTCHQPHVTRAMGIKVRAGKKEVCDTCHVKQRRAYTGSAMDKAGVRCQDCHMGKATKSAIKKGPYEGDVWTHIFRINPAADYVMFSEDGKQAKDALDLRFACLRCHADRTVAEFAKIGKGNYHTIGK